jgi:hypothetical protein
MDRSVFRARLMGPTFIAIALGMLINLGMYENMIAEALTSGTFRAVHGEFVNYAAIGIWNRPRQWYRQA